MNWQGGRNCSEMHAALTVRPLVFVDQALQSVPFRGQLRYLLQQNENFMVQEDKNDFH